MIRIAVIGDIGSGKSYIAKEFGFPVFNADLEVANIYKSDKVFFNKLKDKLPKYFLSFPIKKENIITAILDNEANLKKITNIIHPEIKKRLNIFIKRNKKEKFVILDIPLFLENKLNKKDDILVFVQSKKKEINKRLNNRKNFNLNLLKKFKKIQLSLEVKKKKSTFIIKNNFTKSLIKKDIKEIINIIN